MADQSIPLTVMLFARQRAPFVVAMVMPMLAILALALALALPTIAAEYQVNPGDELQVDVWNEDSLSRKVLVRPDGRVSLPMAGEIDTRGMTPPAVADAIASALSQFMKDRPRVVVSLSKAAGNQVYVLGKVEKPGRFRITSVTDVMQALALAGGLNSFASEDGIRILRRNADGSQRALRFRYSDVKQGKSLDTNILLQSGDVVVVP